MDILTTFVCPLLSIMEVPKFQGGQHVIWRSIES
jgi:hypothetical protein